MEERLLNRCRWEEQSRANYTGARVKAEMPCDLRECLVRCRRDYDAMFGKCRIMRYYRVLRLRYGRTESVPDFYRLVMPGARDVHIPVDFEVRLDEVARGRGSGLN